MSPVLFTKSIKYFVITMLISCFGISRAQVWKTYPYHQPDTYIYFPADEGVHPAEPTEWWYLVGHLNSENSGNYYTIMLTYFHYPDLGFDGFRIFNITNETEDQFYPETLPVFYDVLAADSLNIEANPVGAANESWKNVTNPDGTMVPFKYQVHANQAMGTINLVLDTYKRPLIVGDSGYFFQGGTGNYTYYYSQTGVNVSGSITVDGTTENVSGTAWIDRQYGTFNPYSGEAYEWFSVHLSNGVDMNIWNIFTSEYQIPDTSTYVLCSAYVNDSTTFSTSDFSLQRLQYVYMPDSLQCYAQQWNYKSGDIDLVFTTLSPSREVQMPFRFYEGSIDVTGNYNGEEVTGYGFAELLHSYQDPEIEFTNPDTTATWIEEGETITWHPINPDDGNPLYYTLSCSIDDGQTYQEIVKNTTDTSYYWDFSHLADGTVCTFKLTGASIDGTLTRTVYSDEVTLFIVTGNEEYKNEINDFIIYPNPTKGIVNVRSTALNELRIYNSLGKLIRKVKVEKNNKSDFTINLADEKNGIYLIQVISSNGSATSKVILND